MGKQNSSEAILIIAASENDPNLAYATNFFAPDPFIFMQIGGRKMMILSDLEIDRAKKEANVHDVFSASYLIRRLSKQVLRGITTVEITAFILKKRRIRHLLVPANFPVRYADLFRKKGFRIRWKPEPFFDQRTIKSNAEIKAITKTLRCTERAIEEAAGILKKSKIRGKFLIYKGRKLTSEDIKQVLHTCLLSAGCVGEHTIVSCYNDCVDPHNQGSGPLLAHQSIVMDVFPRSEKTKYFADITRTFVRGKASPTLKKIYKAVKNGQKIAYSQIRNGADGSKIHQDIMDYFKREGFETGKINGRMQGFFHGTGHGVGVEIHEPPRISVSKDILRTNQVVTVEPGLYYRNIGGVRLEDMVVVKKNGCLNLTKLPKCLEI